MAVLKINKPQTVQLQSSTQSTNPSSTGDLFRQALSRVSTPVNPSSLLDLQAGLGLQSRQTARSIGRSPMNRITGTIDMGLATPQAGNMSNEALKHLAQMEMVNLNSSMLGAMGETSSSPSTIPTPSTISPVASTPSPSTTSWLGNMGNILDGSKLEGLIQFLEELKNNLMALRNNQASAMPPGRTAAASSSASSKPKAQASPRVPLDIEVTAQGGVGSQTTVAMSTADKPVIIDETTVAASDDDGDDQLDHLIDSIAKRNRLDPNLVRAVVKTESNFDTKAVSKAGAMGLMQLMPETAKDLGVEDPFDPAENIEGGARYLRTMLDRYRGDLDKALAAYNWGPGNLDRSKGRWMPRETQNYIRIVNRHYQTFSKTREV